MIYMRDRPAKKKTQGQDLTKRLILDELKYKITREINQQNGKVSEGQVNSKQKEDNQEGRGQRPKYQIFKKDHEKKSIECLSSQKIVESIVVDSKENIMVSGEVSRKKKLLTTQKCFDIQIVNKKEKAEVETYLKLLEDENKELKDKIEQLAIKFDQSSQKIVEESSKRMKEYEISQLQSSENLLELKKMISRYQKSFEEGKNILIKASMELIDAKNNVGATVSVDKMTQKQEKISLCLQSIQKIITVYTNLVNNQGKHRTHETLSFQELNSIVKYQQKTIEKLTQSKRKDGQLYRENVLLRYETNRLSKYNQELLKLLPEGKAIYDSAPKKKQEFPSSLLNLSQSMSRERESTPIDRLTDPKSQDGLVRIEEGPSHFENQELWKSQLNEKESRIKNLEIEKEFISDQLISLEKDLEDLQQSYKQVYHEKEEALREIDTLRQCTQKLKSDIEVSEEKENVLNDQIELLKDKIRRLQEKGENVKGINIATSRYVVIPDDQTVTIQSVLKFFKKKELHKYHQALMDLISRYELKISQLTNSFTQEKQFKDKLFSFSRGLYSMVTSGRHLSLEDLVLQISKYQQIIGSISENEIDILLRQIKSFTIGIERHQFLNISSQLEDYVIHLKSRLPALSEEYFEDGSSVSDSLTYADRQDL